MFEAGQGLNSLGRLAWLGLVDTFRTLCIDPTAEIRATFDMMRASGSPFYGRSSHVRKYAMFLTEDAHAIDAKQILEEAHALPEGALINAKAFLRLGSRAAVGQALRRLEGRKVLMRVGRGLYVRPGAHRRALASLCFTPKHRAKNHG